MAGASEIEGRIDALAAGIARAEASASRTTAIAGTVDELAAS